MEEKPLDTSEETGPVTEAIMSLPEKDRQAVLLYYYQELSIKEAAKVAKVTEGAFRQRLKRGRDKLKEILKKDYCNE